MLEAIVKNHYIQPEQFLCEVGAGGAVASGNHHSWKEAGKHDGFVANFFWRRGWMSVRTDNGDMCSCAVVASVENSHFVAPSHEPMC